MNNSNRSSDERDLVVAIAQLPFITPGRLRKLVTFYGEVSRVRSASRGEIAALLGISEAEAAAVANPFSLPPIADLAAKWAPSVITSLDDDYPPLLQTIADPPVVVYLAGRREALELPAVAVVGSRRASPYGENVARLVTRELARSGIAVVSGLARGIDSVAHETAIEQGGTTIAVLGTGIDVTYPRRNRKLCEAIVEHGAILSEFAPGTPPRPENFPIRNRIISGLSLGVIVAEASERSGSLITARLAGEQGRDVFAVPASIFSQSAGAHRLIQDGAKLLHDMDDFFAELPLLRRRPAATGQKPSEFQELLEAIPRDEAVHVDQLGRISGLPHSQLASVLMKLELEGQIRRVPGGCYVREV